MSDTRFTNFFNSLRSEYTGRMVGLVNNEDPNIPEVRNNEGGIIFNNQNDPPMTSTIPYAVVGLIGMITLTVIVQSWLHNKDNLAGIGIIGIAAMVSGFWVGCKQKYRIHAEIINRNNLENLNNHEENLNLEDLNNHEENLINLEDLNDHEENRNDQEVNVGFTLSMV